jgi:putative transposase
MGQKGWHRRGYVPHFDGHGIVQHVVFRLKDSVPPGERDGDDVLDRGIGSSVLKNAGCADLVVEALMHGDPERYQLQAWCVMPNHVHVLLATNDKHELGGIVRLWKSYTATRINRLMGRQGPLWARDYFDRFIRDERHFETNRRYIEMNPVSAGLCGAPEDWAFSSAGWRGLG